MTFRFTRYGFKNALISLIPIFPTWTLFPGVLLASAIEKLTNDCENSYLIVFWVSIVLAILLLAGYAYHLDKILVKPEKIMKHNFRYWSLLFYILTNTFSLIIIVGVDMACNGDGQTILACIYSGPIASLSLIVFGLLMDLITFVAGSKLPVSRT